MFDVEIALINGGISWHFFEELLFLRVMDGGRHNKYNLRFVTFITGIFQCWSTTKSYAIVSYSPKNFT